MPTPNAILTARLNAANRALNRARAIPTPKGKDAFDSFLIGATKLGLLAMFGLFLAAKAENQYPGILNKILPPTPRPSKTPRPTP